MNTTDKIKQLEEQCEGFRRIVTELLNEICKLKEENKKRDVYEFVPKAGEEYFLINHVGDVIVSCYYPQGTESTQRLAFHNAFPATDNTQSLLKDYAKQIKLNNRLMQLKIMLCPDYEPDWDNIKNKKFYIYYDYKSNSFGYNYVWLCRCTTVYFTEEAAEKACEILNNTWKWED